MILPADLKCPHGRIGCLAETQLHEHFKSITPDLALQFEQEYGGEPALEKLEMCMQCRDYLEADNRRREVEADAVGEYDTRELPEDEKAWYLVSQEWVQKWKAYIAAETVSTIGEANRVNCGPVDNTKLAQNSQLSLGRDFSAVNAKVWRMFMHFHGGGPEVRRSAEMGPTGPLEPTVVALPEKIDDSVSWQTIESKR
jgi:hypothetical protein